MRKSKFTDAQIAFILRQAPIAEVSARLAVILHC